MDNLGTTLKQTYYLLTLTISIQLVYIITIRLWKVLRQLVYLKLMYNSNIISVLRAAMEFNQKSIIVIVLSSISEAFFRKEQYRLQTENTIPFIICFIFCALFLEEIGINDCKLNISESLRNMGGVDYGSGMALSYFYGYLQIVLPVTGNCDKGLREKIELFESKEGVSIPVKKLFILIPSSSYIPPDLKTVSPGWMESVETLEMTIKDRAGVKVAEGATPVQTLFEISKHRHKEAIRCSEVLSEILISFYKTLQSLLDDDPQCTDLCELIFYNDGDANGKKTNVAKILLQRIQNETFI
ncbi:stimulator of interferon genes protein isoform X2 [Orussus abietinus]|uniref:stimulator of interferon genes protein isoform X2 n=1 Tax=Orussus abietinus TaxID=222816 RepID=UPI0006254656|nr:stimulator of interferon genes protein isoform X2 [Orussus abietinus]